MAVLGAILGDIAGSRFEFKRPFWLDIQNCELFTKDCEFTDDTVMTLAVKKAVITRADLVKTMKEIGRHYPDCGYGESFAGGYWEKIQNLITVMATDPP